jgi:glutathione S-transferase
MIVVHHLNNSRSQRILWLLEELRLPYEIEFYERVKETNAAPAELKSVHPLGRAPIIVDNGRVVAESAAIIDYIIRHYGGGRLQPSQVDPAYDDYVFWLHYAEGSAILPILLKVNASRIGAGASAIEARIEQAMADDLSYIDSSLSLHDYLLGAALSGADIQLSFVGELAARWTDRSRYPNIEAWVRRFQARPAYRAAIERGGPYSFAA